MSRVPRTDRLVCHQQWCALLWWKTSSSWKWSCQYLDRYTFPRSPTFTSFKVVSERMRMQEVAEMSCRHRETGLSLRDSVRSLVLREGFRIEQLFDHRMDVCHGSGGRCKSLCKTLYSATYFKICPLVFLKIWWFFEIMSSWCDSAFFCF